MTHKNSKCIGLWLHKFVCYKDFPEAYIEICERCHKRRIYRKDPRGHVDKKKYNTSHLREILQPSDHLFSREYPNFGKKK